MVVLVEPSAPPAPTAERDALVHKYLPLARGLPARYRHTHVPLEDLVQVASMSLVMAAGPFASSPSTSFASSTLPTVLGEPSANLRDPRRPAPVTRGLQEGAITV